MDANPTSRKALGLVVAVFVLGLVLGALLTVSFGGRVMGAHREPGAGLRDRRARTVEQLTRELKLSPEQQKQLDSILENLQTQYAAIHKQIAPQTEQVRQQGRGQIRAILTPEQRPKYEEFLQRLDEERKKHMNH